MKVSTIEWYAAAAFVMGAFALFDGSVAMAQTSAADVIKRIDKNGDGLINLSEAKSAAAAVVATIDKDNNGTLTNDELAGRAKSLDILQPVSRFRFWKTEGTLTKEQYLDMVDERFQPATPDDDGTMDAKEFETPEGQALLKLLQ